MAKSAGNSGGTGKRGKAKAKGWRKHASNPANASDSRITLKVKKRFDRFGDNAKPHKRDK
jgi:hypothetical protein